MQRIGGVANLIDGFFGLGEGWGGLLEVDVANHFACCTLRNAGTRVSKASTVARVIPLAAAGDTCTFPVKPPGALRLPGLRYADPIRKRTPT